MSNTIQVKPPMPRCVRPRPRLRFRFRAAGAASGLTGLILAFGLAHAALADDDRQAARVPLSPRYQQECASCHLAYPPRMLPAPSWHRLMGSLPRHFGTDASLDPVAQKEISAWLQANAGASGQPGAAPPEDRITRSGWFIRQHDEVPAGAWKRPAVKSASNCGACHTHADQGDFDERHVRIPR